MSRCLDDNALLTFFGKGARRAGEDTVQRHIDQCARCRMLVAELARGKRAVADEERARIAPGLLLGGRYELLRILGEGGSGVVWEATNRLTRQKVAVKVLRLREPDVIRRFFREARVTAALRHPNIVEVQDVFLVDEVGSPAMVMELLRGSPLSHWVRGGSEPPLPLPTVVSLLRQVASALAVAHGVGVVHRDLKPENIFLVGRSGLRAKLLDFGLAKLAGEGSFARTSSLTKSGAVVGTPYYMAPEQIAPNGNVDPRTDVWALGVIAYECIAGIRPLQGETLGELWRALQDPKVRPLSRVAPRTPQPLAKLVDAMLSKSPDVRPSLATVDEVLAALQ